MDGTLLPIDHIGADRPFHSGRHKRHGMNVQVLTDPFGRLLRASPALPRAVHDLRTAREHGITDALANAGITEALVGLGEGDFLIADGTLIPTGRVAADEPYYWQKHQRHGGNAGGHCLPGRDSAVVLASAAGTTP